VSRVRAAEEHRPVATGNVFANGSRSNPARAQTARAIPSRKRLQILIAGDLAVTKRFPKLLARRCRSSVVQRVVRLYVACCFAKTGGDKGSIALGEAAGERMIPGS